MSQELIDRLEDPASHAAFSPAEQVALAYAEQVTSEAKRVSDALWERLREHYDDGEIVELTAVVGLFAYFNRFNDALQVEVTPPGWPGSSPAPARP